MKAAEDLLQLTNRPLEKAFDTRVMVAGDCVCLAF
jgi:hypothetical protein